MRKRLNKNQKNRKKKNNRNLKRLNKIPPKTINKSNQVRNNHKTPKIYDYTN